MPYQVTVRDRKTGAYDLAVVVFEFDSQHITALEVLRRYAPHSLRNGNGAARRKAGRDYSREYSCQYYREDGRDNVGTIAPLVAERFNEADGEEAVKIAVDDFNHSRVLVFIDGAHTIDLDEQYAIRDKSVVQLLRLQGIPLSVIPA